MTAHARALALAATAVDFELELHERRELDGHLQACGRCRDESDGLHDDARRLASRPLRTVPPARVVAITAALENRRPAWSPAMILVGAILLLLLGVATVAVGGEVLRSLERGRTIEVAPSLTPWRAADEEQQPMLGLNGWTATDRPSGFDGLEFFPQAIVEGDAGWVAVSERCDSIAPQDGCAVTTAVSPDGETWSVVGDPVPLERSSDAGGNAPTVHDVAAGPGGFVLVVDARTDGIDGGSAWWSLDGRAWEAASLGPGSRPTAAVRTADGWLIGGAVTRGDGEFAALWTSSDGRSWVEVHDDAAFRVGAVGDGSPSTDNAGIQDMAVSGGLVVATGMTCVDGALSMLCRGASWHSSDGRTWVPTVLDRGLGCPCVVVGTSDGIYTLDYQDAGNAAGFDTDLMRFDPETGWEVVSDDLLPANDLVAIGDLLLLMTSEPSFETTPTLLSQWLSVSTDGRTWTDIARVDLVRSDINFGGRFRAGPDGSIVADTYWLRGGSYGPRWSTVDLRPPD